MARLRLLPVNETELVGVVYSHFRIYLQTVEVILR